MSVGGVGSTPVMQFVTQTPAAMKGEAIREGAQVLVARKAMDHNEAIGAQLIQAIQTVGKSVDIKA